MKRTGKSKKNGKQYTYYCCEHTTSKVEAEKCDFMTWDVPVKDDCPACGQTMFKKAGKGARKPFCINPACSNFLPEDKRGYPRFAARKEGEEPPAAEEAPEKPAAKKAGKTASAKKTAAKSAKAASAKKPAAKTAAAAKKTTAKKPAAKKTAAKKAGTPEEG